MADPDRSWSHNPFHHYILKPMPRSVPALLLLVVVIFHKVCPCVVTGFTVRIVLHLHYLISSHFPTFATKSPHCFAAFVGANVHRVPILLSWHRPLTIRYRQGCLTLASRRFLACTAL